LNHISRTQAGQSFKAPVQQLWPECADVYAAKVLNPIDLGTMEMKVKNNIYPSIDDFRADVILLYKNSLDFNGIDHIVTSVALEVRDTILKAISDIEGGKGSTILRASSRGS
jgi:bromodomain-containing factor 1